MEQGVLEGVARPPPILNSMPQRATSTRGLQFCKLVGEMEDFFTRTLGDMELKEMKSSESVEKVTTSLGHEALKDTAKELFALSLKAYEAMLTYSMSQNHSQSQRVTIGRNVSILSDSTGSEAPSTRHVMNRCRRVSVADILENVLSEASDEPVTQSIVDVKTLQGTTTQNDDGADMIAEFEVITELGRGNYGVVSLAVDSAGDTYALKTLNQSVKIINRAASRAHLEVRSKPLDIQRSSTSSALSCSSTSSDASNDRPVDDTVEREIALMKRLNHPHVVRLYAVIEDVEEQQVHLVMQYIENGPLATMEQDGTCGTLPIPKALYYMRQVSLGLSYLHHEDIIHRDIKPENILIGKDDHAYVADFGVSTVVSEGMGRRQVGTMAFMSPEMMASTDAGERYGKESDVWAFGVTLFCIIYGRLPFEARTGPQLMRAITVEELVLPEKPHLPPEGIRLMRKLLHKDPEERLTLTQFRHHRFVKAQIATLGLPKEELGSSFLPGGSKTSPSSSPGASSHTLPPKSPAAVSFAPVPEPSAGKEKVSINAPPPKLSFELDQRPAKGNSPLAEGEGPGLLSFVEGGVGTDDPMAESHESDFGMSMIGGRSMIGGPLEREAVEKQSAEEVCGVFQLPVLLSRNPRPPLGPSASASNLHRRSQLASFRNATPPPQSDTASPVVEEIPLPPATSRFARQFRRQVATAVRQRTSSVLFPVVEEGGEGLVVYHDPVSPRESGPG